MMDPLSIAEPTLQAAADKLLDLGIDQRDAAKLLVLYGLQRMHDTAHCRQCLAQEYAAVAEMLDEEISEIAEDEAVH